MPTPGTCTQPDCTITRTDEIEYSAVQAILGQPLGWYSGEGAGEGDLCPRHIAELMAHSNRMQYRYVVAGGGIEATS